MHRDGWVKITPGADARLRTAEFTTKGRRILKAADPAWRSVQTVIVESCGRDKWAALVVEPERLVACAPVTESAKAGR
jgi:hypothetical protein